MTQDNTPSPRNAAMLDTIERELSAAGQRGREMTWQEEKAQEAQIRAFQAFKEIAAKKSPGEIGNLVIRLRQLGNDLAANAQRRKPIHPTALMRNRLRTDELETINGLLMPMIEGRVDWAFNRKKPAKLKAYMDDLNQRGGAVADDKPISRRGMMIVSGGLLTSTAAIGTTVTAGIIDPDMHDAHQKYRKARKGLDKYIGKNEPVTLRLKQHIAHIAQLAEKDTTLDEKARKAINGQIQALRAYDDADNNFDEKSLPHMRRITAALAALAIFASALNKTDPMLTPEYEAETIRKEILTEAIKAFGTIAAGTQQEEGRGR